MRILTIANAAWDDRNAVGNTLSNWFSGWSDLELYSMYTRETPPINSCCQYYYKVTVTDIIKNFFTWKRIGRSFNMASCRADDSDSLETKAVSNIRGWKRAFLGFVVDVIYSTKIWLNGKMKAYIKEVDPDVVFCFAIVEPFRYNIVKYAKRHTKAKVVLWVADDVYGALSTQYYFMRKLNERRYHRLFAMADKVYGVSDMLCNEYSEIFKIPIEPLYKGCDLQECKSDVNKPIQIVYAGNLLYGRDETLMALAEQLKKLNNEHTVAQLSIFSGTHVTDEARKRLHIENTSTLNGPRPYDEIKDIMRQADIVLHVESFNPVQIKNVRLSFSTKIIDCLQSGSCMMVIGPKGIASVEYPRKIEGAVVVDDLSKLGDTLKRIVLQPEQLAVRARQIHEFAQKNHQIDAVRSKLANDLKTL